MRQITFLYLMAVMLSSGQVLADWKLFNSKDDFTDVTNLEAFVSNYTDGMLIVRCIAGKFDVVISFHKYLGSRDADIRYRIDKGEITRGWGTLSTDGDAVFISSFTERQLAKDLMQGEQFLIEATDFRGSKHKQKFSLLGSSAPIQKVLDRCGLRE